MNGKLQIYAFCGIISNLERLGCESFSRTGDTGMRVNALHSEFSYYLARLKRQFSHLSSNLVGAFIPYDTPLKNQNPNQDPCEVTPSCCAGTLRDLHRPMSFTLNNEPLSSNAELAPADYFNKDKEQTRENAACIHKHLRTSALHHNRLAIQSPWVLMTPPMLQKAIPRPVKIKAVHLIPSCVLKLAFKFLSFMIQLFLSWGLL